MAGMRQIGLWRVFELRLAIVCLKTLEASGVKISARAGTALFIEFYYIQAQVRLQIY